MKDLLQLLPDFYKESEVVKAMMYAESVEADLMHKRVKDLQDNLLVDTATWGLTYFEEELGLKVDINKPIEERREAIKAKKRGQGTTTKQMIKDTCMAFTGGQVDIIEKASEYHFILKFIDVKGVPKNIEDFKAMIEEIKPAHLSYELQYLYNTWGMIKHNKWSDIKALTWAELRIY